MKKYKTDDVEISVKITKSPKVNLKLIQVKINEEVSEVVLSDCLLKEVINDTSFVKNLTKFLIKE